MLIVFITVFLLPGFVLGQEDEKETPLVTPYVYAGSLWTFSSEEKATVNTRLGAGASLHLNENWRLDGWSMYEWDNRNWSNRLGLNSFSIVYQAGDTRLDMGKVATVTTFLHRPHPISAGGQFETKPQAYMLGGAYGIRIQKGSLLLSVTDDGVSGDKGAEVNLGVNKRGVKASIWYNQMQAGLAVSTSHGRIETVNVWSQGVVANTLMINLTKCTFFSDVGYDIKEEEWIKSELGLFHEFELGHLKCVPAASVELVNKECILYLWIHF